MRPVVPGWLMGETGVTGGVGLAQGGGADVGSEDSRAVRIKVPTGR